ncbi:MAG: hypothetical protein WCJ45_03725 [bacterium]
MTVHQKELPGSTVIVPCKVTLKVLTFTPPEVTVPATGQLPLAPNVSVQVFLSLLAPKRSNSLDGPPASTLHSQVASSLPFSFAIPLTARLIFPCHAHWTKEYSTHPLNAQFSMITLIGSTASLPKGILSSYTPSKTDASI